MIAIEILLITLIKTKTSGGVNTLSGSNNKNIDNKFRSAVHSKAAEYLMKEYRLNSKIDGIKKLNGKPDPHEGIDESMEVSDSVDLLIIHEQFH